MYERVALTLRPLYDHNGHFVGVKMHNSTCQMLFKRITDNALKICLVGTCFNAFQAAGESRRQVKKFTKYSKNVNIVEFNDHIWNHHAFIRVKTCLILVH